MFIDHSQTRFIVQLVGSLSPLQVVDYLHDVASVSLLARGESELLELLNQVVEVVVDRLEILIESFVVVSL